MASLLCHSIYIRSSFSSLHFSSSSFPIRLLSLTFRCPYRLRSFTCRILMGYHSCNSPELDIEQIYLPPSLKTPFISSISRVSYPSLKIITENSAARKHFLDTKWHLKENLMKRITSALINQGWDLNFIDCFCIERDSLHFIRVLNDLFDETMDAGLVYYMFRMLYWFNGNSRRKLHACCTMVHIAILGNMNHIAMELLYGIVRSYYIDGPNFIFHAICQTRRNASELETACSMLVNCFAKQGMLDIATKLVTRMEQFGLHPSNGVYVAISFLLKSQFTMKGQCDGNSFVEMKSCVAQLIGLTLSLYIKEFCVSGLLNSACKLLYEIQTFGGIADNVTYTVVIDAFCKRGFIKEATILMFKMVQMDLSPDSTLISSLIHGYCKIGKPESAMILLNFTSCVLDAFMYNSFILAWCQNEDVERAHALLNLMFELGAVPDAINYTTVIKAYCGLYQLHYALMTFAQMLKRGVKPTIITYTVLIDGHCKVDEIQSAEHLFNALERAGLQADITTYNTLINGYSKKGFMHRAYELMYLMKKADVLPDSVTYNIIMHGLIKRGFDIKTIFNELITRGYSPDELHSPDKFMATNAIHGYSREGRLEEAYLIWCSMSKRGMSPDVVTCSALLNGFCKKHRMQDADALFFKMLDAGLEPDLILYNTLIRGFCRAGDIGKAHQLLIMMKAKGVFPNDITHSALVIFFEKNGVENAHESAIVFLQQMFILD